MPLPCPLCAGTTDWNDQANSVVCEDCGNVLDATQTTLVTHFDEGTLRIANKSTGGLFESIASATLRTANGSVLAGQSSKARRDAANARAQHEHIFSALRNLGASDNAIFERAKYLFDHGMVKCSYRWGRQANLLSAACILIAMKEYRKGGTLSTVAAVMSLPMTNISKIYSRVVKLLNVDVTGPDPALLLPPLQAHIASLLETSPPFDQNIVKFLSSLPFPKMLDLATRLSSLVVDSQIVKTDLTPPVSCAILMLAIEAIALKPIPKIIRFAEELGLRFGGTGAGVSKYSVMDRYHTILAALLEWKTALSWLPVLKAAAKNDRLAVAHALQDIVQFREIILRKKQMESLTTVTPPEEILVDPVDQASDWSADAVGGESKPAMKRICEDNISVSAKRRKTGDPSQRLLDDASLFLLSPLSNVPPTKKNSAPRMVPYLNLLTKSDDSCGEELSRLQVLLTQRSGGEADITEDELFEEGELEGYMRPETEVGILRVANGWFEDEVPSSNGSTSKAPSENSGRLNSINPNEAEDPSDESVQPWRALSPESAVGLDDYTEWL
ncbi:hypothetical protein SISSUDRAFT_1057109 [Sistotremastrum suecicum HHB10207 ss-3]|uniref:TFIIB-type domain-containing protein n=1 Tax=Sistotremastrum suecicum HHB10207 ss-3 TaxID=1314776 RepID=A0A166IVK5_9AGAM|nr:hypothetical protein SISSUDRAFT_1057109 [Sistotremastrum suecicum HHB10207 ss-3]